MANAVEDIRYNNNIGYQKIEMLFIIKLSIIFSYLFPLNNANNSCMTYLNK
jgi:hypothetical protein